MSRWNVPIVETAAVAKLAKSFGDVISVSKNAEILREFRYKHGPNFATNTDRISRQTRTEFRFKHGPNFAKGSQ